MLKWLHRLLHPHCPECAEEKKDSKVCPSCEVLKQQLEYANYEKKLLLNSIISPRQTQDIPKEVVFPESISKAGIPWAVRKQMLEAEDRKKAALMREAEAAKLKLAADTARGPSGGLAVAVPFSSNAEAERISELEKELGISDEPRGA